MINNNSLNYACLFGGGAIRGLAHVGVIKALNELGIIPTLLCGSSVGSIVAVLYALGYTYDEIEQIFLDVNFELFRDISFGFSQKFAISKGEVFLDWFRDLVEKKFYGVNYKKNSNEPVKFKDINRDLIIITTDLKNFACNEFSTFETPDFEIAMAVRISCCMPGLMRAVNLDNKLLVDGDLQKGMPMWYLSKNIQFCKDRILEIRLEGSFAGTDENPLEYVNGMYSCMTSCETNFIKTLYSNYDKFDYLVINTGNTIVVDFNCNIQKRKDIMNNGYIQTIEYFTDDLLKKKNHLLGIYKNIFVSIQKIKNLLILKKYSNAKSEIANLFIYLSDVKDFIDLNLYNLIKEYQEYLYSVITHGLLGRSRCKDPKIAILKIELILSNIENKINGIDSYIKIFDNFKKRESKNKFISQIKN